jgi:hypothetical protein
VRGRRIPKGNLYAFRLPADLVARVDEYARQLRPERPGSRVTRADALRALLIEALEAQPRRKR